MTNFEDPGPGGAADDSVLTVLEAFTDDGWVANHLVVEGGLVECGECRETSAAGDIGVRATHRVEGASDPDDMQMVVGFPCPRCGAKGAAVVAYGPSASDDAADFLSRVELPNRDDPVSDDS